MREIVHYAQLGTTAQVPTVQVPDGCKWIRVVDFDPLGIVQLNYPSAGPLNIPCQHPSVQIDAKLVEPIYGYREWTRSREQSPFKTIQLFGSVVVHCGEADEPIPPLPYPRQMGNASSFQFGISTNALSINALLPLPKNAKKILINLQNTTGVAAVVSFLHGYLVPQGGVGVSPVAAWAPGLSWDIAPNVPFSNGVPTQFATVIGNAVIGPVIATITVPNNGIGQLSILTEGTPVDDVVNNSFVRTTALATHLAILGTAGALSAVTFTGVIVTDN